jgi:hypothetical protein
MVKEKYTQLSLSRHFGGIRTMNIHRRWATFKATHGRTCGQNFK